VFGVPANAGAMKATTRLKAKIETNTFMIVSSDLGTREANQHKTAAGRWTLVRSWPFSTTEAGVDDLRNLASGSLPICISPLLCAAFNHQILISARR
jgi:hypothetical protein